MSRKKEKDFNAQMQNGQVEPHKTTSTRLPTLGDIGDFQNNNSSNQVENLIMSILSDPISGGLVACDQRGKCYRTNMNPIQNHIVGSRVVSSTENKSNAPFYVGVVLVLLILAIVGFFVWKWVKNRSSPSSPILEQIVPPSSEPQPTTSSTHNLRVKATQLDLPEPVDHARAKNTEHHNEEEDENTTRHVEEPTMMQEHHTKPKSVEPTQAQESSTSYTLRNASSSLVDLLHRQVVTNEQQSKEMAKLWKELTHLKEQVVEVAAQNSENTDQIRTNSQVLHVAVEQIKALTDIAASSPSPLEKGNVVVAQDANKMRHGSDNSHKDKDQQNKKLKKFSERVSQACSRHQDKRRNHHHHHHHHHHKP